MLNWKISTREQEGVDRWMNKMGIMSNANLIDVLINHPSKGYYLPSPHSKCMTRNYLTGVMLGKFFSIKTESMRILSSESLKKVNITSELCYQEIIRLFSSQYVNLGFDAQNLPDKNWLVVILWNFAPQHPLFVASVDENIDEELKAFLPDDLCPSKTYKSNRHPVYKKYLKLKKLKQNIKKEIKQMHEKEQTMKESFSTFLDS